MLLKEWLQLKKMKKTGHLFNGGQKAEKGRKMLQSIKDLQICVFFLPQTKHFRWLCLNKFIIIINIIITVLN